VQRVRHEWSRIIEVGQVSFIFNRAETAVATHPHLAGQHYRRTLDLAPEPIELPQVSRWGSLGAIGLAWIAFFAVMTIWPATLIRLWEAFAGFQLALRLLYGALLLPWVLATWIWQAELATIAQAVVIAAIAIVTFIFAKPLRQE
jgi:hypothetical protein